MKRSLPESHQAIKFLPADIHLPFFAYGVFKPGELAFLRIKDFVRHCHSCSIAASLRIRDGLPIASPNPLGELQGSLIHFGAGSEEQAYRRIAELEPETQYRWEVTAIQTAHANFLAGRNPLRGSIIPDEEVWNGREDPLFTIALDVVHEVYQQNYNFDWNLKPLFHLEMAYLLLWTAIERYASLRYHLGDKATKKVMEIANEPAFINALKTTITEQREVCRADDPTQKIILASDSPERALTYYYQIRNNLVHRGKGVPRDHERLAKSLSELLAIFREVLTAAFEEAQWTSVS